MSADVICGWVLEDSAADALVYTMEDNDKLELEVL